MDIKPHKKHRAIQASINLNQTIKELENLDCQWFLKWFGIYKLQNWYQGKIQKLRDSEK